MIKLVCGVIAACLAVASLSFSVCADWQNQTTLSDSLTLSILGTGGNNIDAYYLATDGTYKACTLTPINTNLTFGASNVQGYANNYWTARECIVYRCPVPADIKYGVYSAKQYYIPFNRHFGNVDFFEFGIASVDNVGSLYDYYLQTNYTNWSDYNSIQAGDDISDVYPLRPRSDTNNGAIIHCEQWDYPFCCFTYESNDKGDFYLGDCYCYPCYSGSQYDYFVISNPRLNDDYIYYGEGYFPPPVTSSSGGGGGSTFTTAVSGSGAGSIQTDSSGVTEFNYNVHVDVPDYEPIINPSYDSSRLDEMSSNIEEYHGLENSLIDDAVQGVDSLPDMEFDSDLIEEAEPLWSFFDINLVSIMVTWVCILSFISYVLFGKWV